MARFIIDVREADEYSEGHVDGSINISPQELMSGSQKLNDIDKDDEVILYCVSGSRSNVSLNILKSLGYTNVVNGINMDHVNKRLSGAE